MPTSDRRRLLFAAAFTTLALPALWVANGERGVDPAVGAAGVPAPVVDPSPVDGTYAPESPVFLNDAAPVVVDAPVSAAAVQGPTQAAANDVTSMATFKRITDVGGCSTNLALPGTTLTVENLDNGRAITCVAVYGVPVPDGIGVVLDTGLLAQITDLAEAPIPVRVTW
jgi:hypothetical protein